jgi:hypothetical protein
MPRSSRLISTQSSPARAERIVRERTSDIARIHGTAAELPDRLADEVRRLSATGVTHLVIETLSRELPRRAASVARI